MVLSVVSTGFPVRFHFPKLHNGELMNLAALHPMKLACAREF